MADETTLAQVFSKPPPYTEEELTLVIARFRESRAQFVTQGKAPKAVKAKAAKPDLSNLDIEL